MLYRLPAAEDLSDGEYQFLLKAQRAHFIKLNSDKHSDFDVNNIVEVIRNMDEYCVDVRYLNGEWFHYYPDGSWSVHNKKSLHKM
ncbi:hypothetical protein [Alkalibacillus almallahensis]|uniref:hypothetical protein n=1 Tax=Alkalibacillus almallahensis TaxID=1379154 RepID=UPI00141ECD56|nr:hypothetical protein [Alkalibacillus almallahensis]NIK12888.1 hypothetical protein [Alkalibacillus almallahensis]